MKKDIIDLIIMFDNYLDNMYDMGVFDLTNPTDAKVNDFLLKMKNKYIK